MKKRILPILLLAILAAAIYHFRFRAADGPDLNAPTLKIYGTIDIRDLQLAFTEQERLTELLVEEGDRIERGQVVARQNSDKLLAAIGEIEAIIKAQEAVVAKLHAGNRPQEISQAEAEVDAAEVEKENARVSLERSSATSKAGASSRQNLDDAKSRYSVAEARLAVARKRLELLQDGFRDEDIAEAEHRLAAQRASLDFHKVRLAERTLVAPVSGTVQSRLLEPGEMAGPSRPVASLAVDTPKWVRAYLPEPLLGHVATGMAVEVISDSFPDRPVSGIVGFISPIAEFTPRTVQTEDLRTQLVYEARVVVDDPANSLRQGMPVTVLVHRTSTGNADR